MGSSQSEIMQGDQANECFARLPLIQEMVTRKFAKKRENVFESVDTCVPNQTIGVFQEHKMDPIAVSTSTDEVQKPSYMLPSPNKKRNVSRDVESISKILDERSVPNNEFFLMHPSELMKERRSDPSEKFNTGIHQPSVIRPGGDPASSHVSTAGPVLPIATAGPVQPVGYTQASFVRAVPSISQARPVITQARFVPVITQVNSFPVIPEARSAPAIPEAYSFPPNAGSNSVAGPGVAGPERTTFNSRINFFTPIPDESDSDEVDSEQHSEDQEIIASHDIPRFKLKPRNNIRRLDFLGSSQTQYVPF